MAANTFSIFAQLFILLGAELFTLKVLPDRDLVKRLKDAAEFVLIEVKLL